MKVIQLWISLLEKKKIPLERAGCRMLLCSLHRVIAWRNLLTLFTSQWSNQIYESMILPR
jgi:hypothetical protein